MVTVLAQSWEEIPELRRRASVLQLAAPLQ